MKNLSINFLQPASNWIETEPLLITEGQLLLDGVPFTYVSDTSEYIHSTENEKVLIEVIVTGYYFYVQEIELCESFNFPIILVPIITDLESPNYNRPFPSSFLIQSCCINQLLIYNNSSFGGKREVYIDKVLITTENFVKINVCINPTLLLIVVTRGQTFTPTLTENLLRFDSYTSVIGFLLQGNTIPYEVESFESYMNNTFPISIGLIDKITTFQLSLSEPNECGCYNIGTDVTITPTLGNLQSVPDVLNCTWKIYANETLINEVEVVATKEDVYYSLPSITFDVEQVGVYKVTLTMYDKCGNERTKEISFETCRYYTLEGSCGEYTLRNYSYSKTLSVSIRNYENEEIENGSFSVLPNETKAFTIPVGLFFIYIDDEQKVLANYCYLEDCMTDYITRVLCGEESCKCEIDTNKELSAMSNIMLTYTLFSQLNQFYFQDTFYKGLETGLLAKVYDAQMTLNKIVKQCKRMGCKQNCDCKKDCGCKGVKFVTTEKKGGCGCHG